MTSFEGHSVANPVIVISFFSVGADVGVGIGAGSFLVKFENIPPMLTWKLVEFTL